jgi:hypothetical protein
MPVAVGVDDSVTAPLAVGFAVEEAASRGVVAIRGLADPARAVAQRRATAHVTPRKSCSLCAANPRHSRRLPIGSAGS